MRGARLTRILVLAGACCVLGFVVATEATAQRGAGQGIKAGLRARVIAAAAVAQLAVRECDYDKWARAQGERSDARRVWYNYTAALKPVSYEELFTPDEPPFPTFPIPCYPQTAARPGASAVQTAQAAPAGLQVQLGAGVSVLNGIKVENGGLGGEQSVALPSLEVLMVRGNWGVIRPEDSLEARLYAGHGSSSVDRAGVGGVQAQPNGSQDLRATGPATNIRSDAEATRFGGSLQYNFPRGSLGLPVKPFLGGGAEFFQLKTNLHGTWSNFGFSFNDSSNIDQTRLNVLGGSDFDIVTLPDMNLFVRLKGQLNLDFVNGDFVYSSQQFGVPLGPPATGSVSTSAVTFSGELGLGSVWTFPNGSRLRTYTWVGFTPVWEADKRVNVPWLLQQDQKTEFGIKLALDIIDSYLERTRPLAPW